MWHNLRPNPKEEPGQTSWCLQVSFSKMLQGQSPRESTACFYPYLGMCHWTAPPAQHDQEHEDPLLRLLSPSCHPPLRPQRAEELGTSRDNEGWHHDSLSLGLQPGWDVYLLTFSFNVLGPSRSEFISFTGAYFAP